MGRYSSRDTASPCRVVRCSVSQKRHCLSVCRLSSRRILLGEDVQGACVPRRTSTKRVGGDQPTDNERAMLVACCDHGKEPPSPIAARASSSTGDALHVATATGLLAMRSKHGRAVSAVMEMLISNSAPEVTVREALIARYRLPGFGNKVYAEHDPRTTALFARAQVLGYRGGAIAKALAIERELCVAKRTGAPVECGWNARSDSARIAFCVGRW